VTLKKNDLKKTNSIGTYDVKETKLVKLDEIMDELTDEISTKLNKMKIDSDNNNWRASLAEKIFINLGSDKKRKDVKGNKNKEKDKNKKINVEGDDEAIDLNIKEDYDWNYSAQVF